MKKFISTLLCCVMFMSLFSIPMSISANTVYTNNDYKLVEQIEKSTTSDGWSYSILKEQNIHNNEYRTVAYVGQYVGKNENATLPVKIKNYKVVEAGQNAIENNTYLKKLIIPDSDIKIESVSFWGSSTLETVVIGSAVSNIYTSMFESDTKLTTVKYTKDFLAQKPYVGPRAFAKCKSLKNIEFPDGFVGMSYMNVFEDCTNLETIICGHDMQMVYLHSSNVNMKSLTLNYSKDNDVNFSAYPSFPEKFNDGPLKVYCHDGTRAAYFAYNNFPGRVEFHGIGPCKGEPYVPVTQEPTTAMPPYTTTINENSEYYISADFLNNNWAKDESGKLIYDPSSKTLYRTYILNKGTYEYIVTTEDDEYRFNSTGGGILGAANCPKYEKFTVSEDNTEVKFILDGVKVRFEMNGVEETIPTTTTIPETTTTRFRPTTVVPSTTISNIATIVLSKYSDEVEAGTYTYDYSYNYYDDNSTIEFTSSDNTVVQVNQPKNNNSKTGTFQIVALGAGKATITATVYSLGGVNVGSAKFNVTVKGNTPVKPTTPGSDTTTTNPSQPNPTAPTVDVNGIKVKLNNNSNVLANNKVVNLQKTKKSLKLNASVTPSNATNKAVTYSYNKNIINVDKNGKVTALKNGYTNLTVKSNSNPKVKFVVKITVGPTATKVVAPQVRNIAKNNGKTKVNATAQYGKKKNIYKVAPTWKSSNNKVATVDSNGIVTAKTNKGYCYVTATINDGKAKKSNSCLIVVGNKVSKVTRYKTPYTNKVKKGKKVTLKAEVKNYNATYKNCSWSTNNKKQISISKAKCYVSNKHFYVQATVKAKKKGTYYVYAKTKDGSNKTLRYKIVVK